MDDHRLGESAHQRLIGSDDLLDQPVGGDLPQAPELEEELVVVARHPQSGQRPADVGDVELADVGAAGHLGQGLEVLAQEPIVQVIYFSG